VFANVVMLALRYALARYGSFVKLATIDTTDIVFLHRIVIVLMRERPFKARRRGLMSLRTISDGYLDGHCRADQQNNNQKCANANHEQVVQCFLDSMHANNAFLISNIYLLVGSA